jgi:putative phage-type endonuclease
MLTKKQAEKRKNFLGSSDVAAVLGLDPFRTPYDVYAEKTGKVAEEESEKQVLSRGRYMETALLKYSEHELGKLIVNPANLEFSYGNFIIDHPDAQVAKNRQPVEAKSVGQYANYEEWGKPGTDEVPERVIIQCQVHLICCGSDYCHVPAYLPYREFQLFGVPKDVELVQMILDRTGEFWNKHIKKDTPPDSFPSLDIARRMIRQPKLTVKVSDAIIFNWLNTKNTRLLAEKREEAARCELMASLGTAEIGKFSQGKVTYFESFRKGYTVRSCKTRTLRIEKNKSKGLVSCQRKNKTQNRQNKRVSQTHHRPPRKPKKNSSRNMSRLRRSNRTHSR